MKQFLSSWKFWAIVALVVVAIVLVILFLTVPRFAQQIALFLVGLLAGSAVTKFILDRKK